MEKIRVLRRRVIIREYDFIKLRAQAFAPLSCMGITDTLYDRAEFLPFTEESLSKDYMMMLLGSRQIKNLKPMKGHPANWLADMSDYLYNKKYIDYHPEIDKEDGFIYVRARKNTPRTKIGWGVFEKDIVQVRLC